MKKLLLLGLATTLCVGLFAAESEAFGRRGRGGCAPTYGCGSGCDVAVSYVQKQVTTYKAVWKTKPVQVQVQKVHYTTKKVPYDYYECVAKTDTVMRDCTTYKTQKVPCEYWACVPKTDTVMRDVTTYTTKKVPYEYWDCIPQYKTVMQNVTCHKYVPQTVMQTVTRYETVRKTVVDPCTGCTYTVCCRQPVCVQVPCTTYKCVPETKQVPVKVCTYTKVKKTGHRHECVPVTSKVPCKVVTYHKVKKTGHRLECVPVTTKVPCQVVTYHKVKKTGHREVCVPHTTTETVTVQQRYCETVPVVTTVCVPVYHHCATPCPSPCGGTGSPVMPHAH